MPTLASNKIASYQEDRMYGVRTRALITVFMFLIGFSVVFARIIDLGLSARAHEKGQIAELATARSDLRANIVDRNGVLLATDLEIVSLYANPLRVIDPDAAAAALSSVLGDIDRDELLAKLTAEKKFVWLKRKLTPHEVQKINNLGIPGIGFEDEVQRFYPQGPLTAHVVGFNDIDNKGLGGIERQFEDKLHELAGGDEPLQLSIDTRVQHALRDELLTAMGDFRAQGAAGIVLRVGTGEILALASLPDFNPNHPGDAAVNTRYMNRASHGVYEMGSTFKTFTVAMALEKGIAGLHDSYDATNPIKVSRFTIKDDHPKARRLTLSEIYMYSSNIGSAKIAVDAGKDVQQDFLQRLGLLNRPVFDLPEVGTPIVPAKWRDINTMTVAFGHGIAISGLQLVNGISALVNGGVLRPATLIKKPQDAPTPGTRVIREETSQKIQALMRLVVEKGTGRNANAEGYLVGGKTGTAEKSGAGGYRRKALVTSFVAAFPITDPQYVVFVMIDEPKGNQSTFGYASAGWTAAPVVRHLVPRIAPILGVPPTPARTHPLTEQIIRTLEPEVSS